jgi:urate oxidase
MARFTKEKTEKKKRDAKDLYIKGFELETIAEITEIKLSTIKIWAKEGGFETARQSNFIALSELRNTILESFIDLKNGNKPKIKPDEAAKYASAFEKLSDKKKVLSYMYESFDMLTDELIKDVQSAKSKKDKELALEVLKKIREKTDTILTRLTAEALSEN